MCKKRISHSNIYLNDKICAQVRVYFFNIAISEKLDQFRDFSKRELLLHLIDKDYKQFFEQYKNSPKEQLAKLLSVNMNDLPAEIEKGNYSILINKLLKLNRGYKANIFSKSKIAITESWLHALKEGILDFIKWVPTTILITGFFKALILSVTLDYKLSFLFSFQDYWDYGVSQSVIFLSFIVIIFLLLVMLILLSEFSHFNYIEEAKIRYGFDSRESKHKLPFLGVSIIGIIVCFILPHYFVSYMLYIEFALTYLLFMFSLTLYNWITHNTSNFFLAFSVVCIICTFTYNLWKIPNFKKSILLQSSSNIEIIHDVDLPDNVFYMESTSKYHIFSNGEQTFLIPIGEVHYITNIIKKNGDSQF